MFFFFVQKKGLSSTKKAEDCTPSAAVQGRAVRGACEKAKPTERAQGSKKGKILVFFWIFDCQRF